MSKKLCHHCTLQIRRFCSNAAGARSPQMDAQTEKKFRILDRVFSPWEPITVSALARKLTSEVLYYVPGDVVVVNKPYGVSCLGYKQANGGVFKSSRYDMRPGYRAAAAGHEGDADTIDFFDKYHDEAREGDITLERALPILAEQLDEPGLHFCIGLKRYVSGPVVLPCSPKAYSKIKQSFFHANSIRYTGHFLYHALAICINKPPKIEETVTGYATFQPVRNNKEYIFIPGEKASQRAVSGKYAVEGELKYHVLDSGFGCSLVELRFNKFSRHIPRLILSHLGCPILGDSIYDQRLISVDGRPISVEPKDRWRGEKQQYEPKQLLGHLQIKSYAELRKEMPLLLTVYQSNYPQFGETKRTRNMDLIVRAKPPDHFHAMAKALNFDKKLHSFLERLEETYEQENLEPPIVGKDRKF